MANVKPEGVLSAPTDVVRSEAFRQTDEEKLAMEVMEEEMFLQDYKARYGHMPRWP